MAQLDDKTIEMLKRSEERMKAANDATAAEPPADNEVHRWCANCRWRNPPPGDAICLLEPMNSSIVQRPVMSPAMVDGKIVSQPTIQQQHVVLPHPAPDGYRCSHHEFEDKELRVRSMGIDFKWDYDKEELGL